MKIAVYHNLPSGGAKRHTFEQVRELARRGHQLVEFAPTTADLDYCSFAPYVRERRVYEFDPIPQARRRIPLVTPYLHLCQGIATLRALEQLNRAIAAEIDSSGFERVLVKDCQISMNPYVLRYFKTPSAFQCHHGLRHRLEAPSLSAGEGPSTPLTRLKRLYYRPAKKLYERKIWTDEARNAKSASVTLTNSRFSRQLMAEYYGVDANVVYPGINTDVFRPLSLERLDYVLCVGALIYGKGYRFLVSALAKIDAERRPVLFVAANSADPDEESVVRAMAADLGVKLHVERIVDDDRLVQVYNQARAFVYAPLQEALGMAPLEALACGTPVVAVAEGGVRETVRDGLTGWLVERDTSSFAKRLSALLGDDNRRRSLGQAGVDDVRKNWTWSRAVDQLEVQLGRAGAGKS